jgi:hypothetical protein
VTEPKKRRVNYTRPKLTGYQIAAFFHALRYAWIEGTTKAGKTHCAIVWLFEQACFGKFKNYWWVAPTYKAAKIAYTRMAGAIPKGLRKLNETDLTITLPNGHIIWFLSGEKPDNLYGEDVGAVVIDEASRLREAAWWAIRSVVTFTQGKVRAIGNVKGRKNWFYKKCRETQEAMVSSTPTDSHWAIITAADAVREGILPQSEIEDAKRELPHDVFQELYFGIPTEDGSNPFGIKFIAACATLDAPTGRPTVARGLDVARAVDWTVPLGLDAAGAVSEFDRFQKPWEEFYVAVKDIVDKDSAMTLVDSTGIGDVILSRLQNDRPRRFEGYKFTSDSKQKLMEGLAVAIQKKEVHIPRDGPIRMELENFEFEYTKTGGVKYSAPDGFHDDCVMSLALAVAAKARVVKHQEARVYPNWGDANELAALSPYHADCWKRGMVAISNAVAPSERRPWSVVWFATFPNNDVVAFSEWPGFDLAASTDSPLSSMEEYRAMILETEAGIKYAMRRGGRVIDPDHADEDPAGLIARLARSCAPCAEKRRVVPDAPRCPHAVAFRPAPDADSVGHAAVRAAIGGDGVRPRLYAMKDACSNFCYAMRHYAFVEEKKPEKGPSEKTQKRDRGMAGTVLFVYNAKLDQYPREVLPLSMVGSHARGRGTPNT